MLALDTNPSLGLGGGGLATPQTSNTAYVPSQTTLQGKMCADRPLPLVVPRSTIPCWPSSAPSAGRW